MGQQCRRECAITAAKKKSVAMRFEPTIPSRVGHNGGHCNEEMASIILALIEVLLLHIPRLAGMIGVAIRERVPPGERCACCYADCMRCHGRKKQKNRLCTPCSMGTCQKPYQRPSQQARAVLDCASSTVSCDDEGFPLTLPTSHPCCFAQNLGVASNSHPESSPSSDVVSN